MILKITEYDITKLLARRHVDDMFFRQVKNGPTQTAHHSRIDALAIRISWSHYVITGYEIKISRSDFMGDDKWQSYLPMCSQLYFVTTPGVCDVSEVPEPCGLIQTTANGNGLRTLKKAAFREIEHPVEMYRYLMFSHIGSLRERDAKYPRGERLLQNERLEVFKDYLSDKAEMRSIGRRVRKKLREGYEKLERELERNKQHGRAEYEAGQEMAEICKELGVTRSYQRLEQCIAEIKHLKASGGVSTVMASRIQQIYQIAGALAAEIGKEGEIYDEHGE